MGASKNCPTDNELAAKAMVHINQLAIQEIRQKNYKRALDYFTQSLVLEEKLGMKAQVGKSFYNMAGVYFLMEDYENALHKAQLAEALFKGEGQTSDAEKARNMIFETDGKMAR